MSRIVIKIGSSLLTNPDHSLNKEFIYGLAEDIAKIHGKENKVLIVTSGAVAAGRKDLKLVKEDKTLPFKQCFAAVGQSRLMSEYHKALHPLGITIAQALLTRHDFKDRKNYLNVRDLFLNLLEHKVIPIVNENDVTSIRESVFAGNDNLAALVAVMIDADMVIFMTDVDGLYTGDPKSDPNAQLIPVVEKLDKKMLDGARHVKSSVSVGGMHSKVLAAHEAVKSGITAYILDGRKSHVLTTLLLEATPAGTKFMPVGKPLDTRKQWLVANMDKKNHITVDDKAVEILRTTGKSLLAKGITGVVGEFQRGDVVIICSTGGECFACGQVAYDAKDIAKIKGLHSKEIEKILGFYYGDEVIHRDNFVVL
jgi:glutamate 5-kinase